MRRPPTMSSSRFVAQFELLSKAALIDTLWCACQLGTDESAEQIETQAARNAVAALEHRRDRVPATIRAAAGERIDSDGDGPL